MIATPGDIAWFVSPGRRASHKPWPRPHIVLGQTAGSYICVACSTTVYNPNDWCNVALPNDPVGSTETKLKRPSWAVCNWIVSIEVEKVVDVEGHVPPDLLREIFQKVRQCAPPPATVRLSRE